MQKNLKNDILPGIIFLVLAVIFVFLTPDQIRTTETSAFTARTFPCLTLGAIIICSVLLIVIGGANTIYQALAGKNQGGPITAEDHKAGGNYVMTLEIFLLVAAAVVIGGIAGLMVSGLLLTIGFLVLYHDKKIIHYVIVIMLVIAFYYLFKIGFGLKLP